MIPEILILPEQVVVKILLSDEQADELQYLIEERGVT
jgi:hypothetical protein